MKEYKAVLFNRCVCGEIEAKVRQAMEKQTPIKPVDNHHCPSCHSGLPVPHITDAWCACCFFPPFCMHCGQAIDWSDGK